MQCPEQECLCDLCSASIATQKRNENQSRNLQNLCTVIKREGSTSIDRKKKRCISLDRLANSVCTNPDGIISLCWLGRHRNVLDFSDEDLINQGKKCKIYLVGESCSVKIEGCRTTKEEYDLNRSYSEGNIGNVSNENFVHINCEDDDFDPRNNSSFHHQYTCPITHDSVTIAVTNNELCKPINVVSRLEFENNLVLDELLSLCETIHAFGYEVSDEPEMKAITYGELYELYLFKNLEQEKMDLASICYLARQHSLLQFEGDCLSIPKDEELAIFLVRTIDDIRKLLGSENPNVKEDNIPNAIEKEKSADQIGQINQNFASEDLDIKPEEKFEDRHSCDIDVNNFQPIDEKNMPIDNPFENEPEQSESSKRFEELNNYCKSAYQCASALLDNQSIHILITCQNQEAGECDFLVGENRMTHSNFSKQSKPLKESKCEYSQTDETIREVTCQTDFEEESKPMIDLYRHCRRKSTSVKKNSAKDIFDTHVKSPQLSKSNSTMGNNPTENNKKIEGKRKASQTGNKKILETGKDNFICHCSKLEISVSQHRSRCDEKEDYTKRSISKSESIPLHKIDKKTESSNSRHQSRSDEVSEISSNDVRKCGGNSRSHSKNRLGTSQILKQSVKPSPISKLSTTKNDITKSLQNNSEKSPNTSRIYRRKPKCDFNTSIQYRTPENKSRSKRLRSGYSTNELSLKKVFRNIPGKQSKLNLQNKKNKAVMRTTKSSQSIKCDKSFKAFHLLKPNLQVPSHIPTPNVFIYPRLLKNKDFLFIDETRLQGEHQDKNTNTHIKISQPKHQA